MQCLVALAALEGFLIRVNAQTMYLETLAAGEGLVAVLTLEGALIRVSAAMVLGEI